ncbi:MAG TPA: Trm112 family protein [Anaeromyxobacter sp.]|nr:Trm112 family protein [Anaeromyxobacter sp.]
MPVPAELKEILACPRCKGPLEFRDEAAEIRCLSCRLVFRVEEDIPVMLLEEARPLE